MTLSTIKNSTRSNLHKFMTATCFAALLGTSANAFAQTNDEQTTVEQTTVEQTDTEQTEESQASDPQADVVIDTSGRTSRTIGEAYADAPTATLSRQGGFYISPILSGLLPADGNIQFFKDAKDITSGGIEVGVSLGAWLLPGLRAGVLYDSGGFENAGVFDRDLIFDWRQHRLMLVADWGPEFFGLFRPALRLGGGWAAQELHFETYNTSQDATDHGLAGFAALRLEVFTPPNWLNNFRMSLAMDIGATGQTGADFDDFNRPNSHDDDQWDQKTASLGTLDLAGGYAALSLSVAIAF